MILFLLALLAAVKARREFCYYGDAYIHCENTHMGRLPPIGEQIKDAIFRDCSIYTIDSSIGPFNYLDHLDLSGNHLKSLTLKEVLIQHLNVSRNPLKSLTITSPILELLDVSHCALRFFSDKFFKGVPGLKELYAHNNPLKLIYPNSLHVLVAHNSKLKALPDMPNLEKLDVSYSKYLENFKPGESLEYLNVSNCILNNLQLNDNLKYLDVSYNKLTWLELNEQLEFLNATGNHLLYIGPPKSLLKELDISNNSLSVANFNSPFLKDINLSKNPIMELRVSCDACRIDCSFCQVRNALLSNVKFLNLTWNDIETIKLENVKEVDLRYNRLKDFRSNTRFFDVRHNFLLDVEKLNVTGIGLVSNNPWCCKKGALSELERLSAEKHPCKGGGYDWETCSLKKKQTVKQGFIIFFSLLLVLVVFLCCHRFYYCIIEHARFRSRDVISEAEERVNNDLPSYEEALTMPKPDWGSRNRMTTQSNVV